MASLKRLYGLREASVNVPDKDLPGLRAVIGAAVSTGHLPPEASGWVPPQGTPSAGVPQTSAEPKKKGRPKKADAEPAKPAAPPPMSADTRAALDKSSSAWDSLAQQVPGAAPKAAPTPAAPAAAPKKPGMFDPTDQEIGFDPRSQGNNAVTGIDDMPAPKSANVDLKGSKKPGGLGRIFGLKPKAPPAQQQGAAMEPKQGMLSKVFKKGGPKVKGNAADDDATSYGTPAAPQKADPNAARRGQDWVNDMDAPGWAPGDGDAAMGDLKNTLAQNPAEPAGGQAAMNNLTWDLKRAKGKR